MPSTFWGLDIAKTGLFTYQAALNTTGHNISNLETPGYSRQFVRQEASNAIRLSSRYGMAGNGVEAKGIFQRRSEYHDVKYRNNNTTYGNYNTKAYYAGAIENNLNEFSKNAITASFQDLDNAMKDLVKQTDKTGLPQRHQVAQSALAFTEYFNELGSNLKGIQNDANFEIKIQVNRVNSIAEQISVISKQINKLETDGSMANDLRDKRNLLVDELSQIVSIEAEEIPAIPGQSTAEYKVRIKGQLLVSSDKFYKLQTTPREKKINQNDVEGLYEISWATGEKFTTAPGGTIGALLGVRDGNDQQNLNGKTGVAASKGDKKITLTGSNINDINKLNISPSGIVTIDHRDYKYSDFEVKILADGQYEYTFNLEEGLAKDISANSAIRVGDSINYKGVPYYMAQMNEFVRTYASKFNEIHRQGQDLGKDQNYGVDFFNAKNTVASGQWAGTDIDPTTHKVTNGFADHKTDKGFNSKDSNYYQMTLENFTVTDDIIKDPLMIAAADPSITDGTAKYMNLDKLIKLKTDSSMFKQGTPDAFIQTAVVAIGVDAKKAEDFATSQEMILSTIDNQRLSVSGVDFNEEGMNMIRYKEAFNLSAKMISVMNEIYGKLINEMGV